MKKFKPGKVPTLEEVVKQAKENKCLFMRGNTIAARVVANMQLSCVAAMIETGALKMPEPIPKEDAKEWYKKEKREKS